MLQIPSIRLESLGNGDHFKFHSDVIKLIKSDATISEKVADLLAKYEAAFKVEDANYELSQKSFDTDAIAAADSRRDSVYIVLKKNVTSFSKLDDATMAAAATKLLQMLTDYHLSTSDNLNRESGKLLNIIDDCEKKYSAEVETLGLGVIVSTLKAANEEVIKLMDSRGGELAQRKVGAMRDSRAAVDEIYRAIIQFINALIVVNGETDYAAFAERLSSDISYYKKNSLGQKTASSSSSNGGSSSSDDNGGSSSSDSGDDNGGSSSSDDNGGSSSSDSGDDSGSSTGGDNDGGSVGM